MKFANCVGKCSKEIQSVFFYGLTLEVEKSVGDKEDGFSNDFKIVSCEVQDVGEFEDFMDFNSIDYSSYDLSSENDLMEIVMNNFYNLVFEQVFHGQSLIAVN